MKRWVKIWEREYFLNRIETVCKSLSIPEAKQIMGFKMRSAAGIVMPSGNVAFCAGEKDWDRFLRYIARVFYDPRQFRKFLVLYSTYKKELLAESNIAMKQATRATKPGELARIYERFNAADLKGMLVVQWFAFYLAELADEYAQKTALKYYDDLKKQREFTESVLSPVEMSSIRKERENLLKIALEKNANKKEKMIDQHVNNFEWIPCINVFSPPPWGKKHFLKELGKLRPVQASKELEKLKHYHRQVPSKFSKAVNVLNKKDRDLAKQAQTMAFLKDDRDDTRRKAYFKLRSLLQKCARIIGLKQEDLLYFSRNEIIKFLRTNTKPSKAELKKRKQGYAVVYDEKQLRIYTGKDVKIWQNKIDKASSSQDVLTGISASPGKVIGKAKVIPGIFQIRKMRRGDILVTVATHPDYLPAMRIARAIITDEGGLTSHAAIVSRELKIPCVVGTKTATHVLKDNDMIEVDAERGIVRKLRKQ